MITSVWVISFLIFVNGEFVFEDHSGPNQDVQSPQDSVIINCLLNYIKNLSSSEVENSFENEENVLTYSDDCMTPGDQYPNIKTNPEDYVYISESYTILAPKIGGRIHQKVHTVVLSSTQMLLENQNGIKSWSSSGINAFFGQSPKFYKATKSLKPTIIRSNWNDHPALDDINSNIPGDIRSDRLNLERKYNFYTNGPKDLKLNPIGLKPIEPIFEFNPIKKSIWDLDLGLTKSKLNFLPKFNPNLNPNLENLHLQEVYPRLPILKPNFNEINTTLPKLDFNVGGLGLGNLNLGSLTTKVNSSGDFFSNISGLKPNLGIVGGLKPNLGSLDFLNNLVFRQNITNNVVPNLSTSPLGLRSLKIDLPEVNLLGSNKDIAVTTKSLDLTSGVSRFLNTAGIALPSVESSHNIDVGSNDLKKNN